MGAGEKEKEKEEMDGLLIGERTRWGREGKSV